MGYEVLDWIHEYTCHGVGDIQCEPLDLDDEMRDHIMESLNYQLRKVTKNRGHFPSDDAVVKLLWLAICNIEDKCAREREKQRGLPPNQRTAAPRLVEGQVTTNWKQALAQLAIAYPDRINPYL